MKRPLLVLSATIAMAITSLALASSTYAGRTYIQLKKFEAGLLVYAVRDGRAPANAEELNKLVLSRGDWFSTHLLKDAWGQPIRYRYPSESETRAFDLYSSGSNLKDEHGGGDDVVPWEYRHYHSTTNRAKDLLLLIVLLDAPLILLFMLARWLYRKARPNYAINATPE